MEKNAHKRCFFAYLQPHYRYCSNAAAFIALTVKEIENSILLISAINYCCANLYPLK